MQCTCKKTCIFTCFYAAITSRRKHAIAHNKARKLRATSPAGCRLTHLEFSGEFSHDMIADCLQLQVIFFTVAGIFACDCVGGFFLPEFAVTFDYVWWDFFCDSGVFACKLHVFCLQEEAILHDGRVQICMSST